MTVSQGYSIATQYVAKCTLSSVLIKLKNEQSHSMGSTEDVFYDADDFSTCTSSETFVVSSSSQQRNSSSPVRSEEEFELADDFSAHSSSALPCPSKPGPSQPRRELATQSSAASKGCVSSASMSTASSLQPEQTVLKRPNELPLALRLLIAKEGYLCREYHRTRCPILRNQVIAHQVMIKRGLYELKLSC